ncbi:MAG: glutamate racemase [Patescibacteria group bacterium]
MIGFYDSGIGGITILQEVLKIKPELSYIYLADTQILPLGDKPLDFIQNRVKKACQYLFENGCSIVVLACNTASVTTIRHIQQVWLAGKTHQKVLGVTKPLVEMLEDKFSKYKNCQGVILSTQATHNSGFYQYEFLKSGFINLNSIPCTGLADAIENNNEMLIHNILETQLKHFDATEIDYVVLACTHYKWAIPQIQQYFNKAEILEPSQFVAERLVDYIDRHSEIILGRSGESRFLATFLSINLNKALALCHLGQEIETCSLN